MNNNNMTNFFIVDNPEGTQRIECRFIVYRAKFGHHPSYLENLAGDAREGFNTKFFFIVEDDIEKNAAARLAYYQNKYDSLIDEIENDDAKWDEFPFKDSPLSYWK